MQYHGYVPEKRLQELRREVAAAVVPSIWMENSPLTINESFAQGVPVIGSDIGGIPELVTEGETGFLFEPESVTDLIKAIEQILINKTNLHQLRNHTLNWAAKRPMDEHVDKLEEIVYDI